MTTVRDIITRAHRLLGVVAAGESLSADDGASGLEAFLGLLDELLPDLLPVSVTGDYETAGNRHLLVDGTAGALTVTLPADPSDGMRVQVTDIAADFATHNVTVARNGRLLEGSAANQTLATNGISKTWMYRGDTGNWHLLSTLAQADTLPFPSRYDQALAAVLAVVLQGEFGAQLAPGVVTQAEAGRRALEARYADTSDLIADRGLWPWPRTGSWTGEE